MDHQDPTLTAMHGEQTILMMKIFDVDHRYVTISTKLF